MHATSWRAMHSRIRHPFIASVAWLIFGGAQTQAQELEPRAYSPSPTGANIVVPHLLDDDLMIIVSTSMVTELLAEYAAS